MILLDEYIYKSILRITCTILEDNFFYDKDSLKRFLDNFTEVMHSEYYELECMADRHFIFCMKYDPMAKRDFTSYFVSYHLHTILVDRMNFSDMELDLFENILPKFVGVQDAYADKGNERTRY